MIKVAVLYSEKSKRLDFLLDILKRRYKTIQFRNEKEVMCALDNDFDNISILIVDRPSTIPYFEKIRECVSANNSYMFSMPIIIASDSEHIEKDDAYLEPPVVGIINEFDTERIITQRIDNTIKFANSSSFSDFSNMLTALPSLIYLKDSRGRYAFCSKHWFHIYKDNESIRGKTDFEIRKDNKNAKIAREADLEVIRSGVGKSYVIKESNEEEGTEYLQIIKEPLKDEKGNVTGIIAIINNVTDEEILRQELREKSITDQLTGLYNRMYFEEVSQQKAKVFKYPVTVISCDCDDLKIINDKFGHAAGDKYICLARDVLKDVLPKNSYLMRMGGDEFLAIVPNTSDEEGMKLVNKIKNVSKDYKTDDFCLKISVGHFTAKDQSISVEMAVLSSDKAMYKDKQSHKKSETI